MLVLTIIVLVALLTAVSILGYVRVDHWKKLHIAACQEGQDLYNQASESDNQYKQLQEHMEYMKASIGQLLSRPIIAVLNEKDAANLQMSVLAWLESQRNPNKVN